MIAGGGLGAIDAREIGPTSEHARNGVVDLVARDDAHALQMAKQFLSYFQGPLKAPEGGGFRQADQRRLRSLVPENRKRSYDMRKVVETLADDGTWLELRSGYAQGMISGLMRIDGKPLGVLANSPTHLAGAVDSDGALKAARFMELLDAFDLPLLNLVDSPGFMVGPPSERQAAVRKMARMFNVGASLDVPFFSIVLRKAYGLGAMAMAGGSSVGPNVFHVSWPSAEAGPMNLEGAVSLGFAKELAKAEEGPARDALFQKLVDVSYERGGALSVARTLETDDVIDPAESREWISAALEVAAAKAGGAGGSAWRERRNKKRPCVSPW
jgi:acetyl-CoA carboxylase carboxyltransferase component